MKVLRSSVVDNGVVVLDDTQFIECEFNRCEIHYGGGPFALSHTALNNPKRVFTGHAFRTIELLKHIGVLKGDPSQWAAAPLVPVVDPENTL